MRTPGWRYLRFWRADVRADVDEELRFHLGERVEELIASGVLAEDAWRRAIDELGDFATVREGLVTIDERVRRKRGRAEWWSGVVDDVRYALRGFRRAPMFTATVGITLALGVGANVTVLALAEHLFVRPPNAVVHAEQVRRIYLRSTWTRVGVAEIHAQLGYPQFTAIAASAIGRAAFAAYTSPDTVVVGEGEERSIVMGSYVDAAFFSVLGVAMERGRPFAGDEVRFGSPLPVAIISDAYWRGHFGGDGGVIGRQAVFDRVRYTIIGVAARAFRGTDLTATDVWLPLANRSDAFPRNPWYAQWHGAAVRGIGRVPSGESDVGLAAAATAALRRGELANQPSGPDTATVMLGPILEALGPSISPRMEAAVISRLIGIALVLLLVACANVGNLLLARAVSRRREVAVRLALGVSRGRLLAQLLSEGVTISLIAAVVAVGAGFFTGPALARLIVPDASGVEATPDWRAIVATFAIAIVTGVLASLAPALHARRTGVADSLKVGAGAQHGATARLRPVLVVAQTALSLSLIVGAGLFVRSLREVQAIDVGYDMDRLVFGTVSFVDAATNAVDKYGRTHREETAVGLRTAVARLQHAPGVDAVALTTTPPMRGGYGLAVFTDAGPVPRVSDRGASVVGTTPGFFTTSGVELRRGRLYGDGDDDTAPPVAVVSETAASEYWPGQDAIGQCLHFNEAAAPCTRVVGVTKDSHEFKVIEERIAEVFLPVAQQRGLLGRPIYILVRATPRSRSQAATMLRNTLRTIFPAAEPPAVRTVSSLVEPELRPWRLGAALFSVFGGLALMVALIGVYSATSYSVSERLRELGIRSALGASAPGIVRLVVSDALRNVGLGIVAGIGLSVAGGRLVGAMLFATSPSDARVLLLGSVGLGVLAMAASAIPALRASRADPMVVLRGE